MLQCAVENLTLGTCVDSLGLTHCSSRLSCLTTLVTQLQIWPADRFVGLAIWLWLSFGPGLLSRRRPPTALSCDLPLDGLSSCQLLAEHSVLSTQAFTSLKTQIQHYTVDYLAQGSMKNGANSEMPCELQDT